MDERCHCGRLLHYTDPATEVLVRGLIARLGETVLITVQGVTYAVQRHYLALHGVKGWELPTLGFPVVRAAEPVGE